LPQISRFSALFFLKTAERPEEAPASSLKRELNENLQRIAGIGTLFYLLLKTDEQIKHLLNFSSHFTCAKIGILKYESKILLRFGKSSIAK
jgi:hypothetical protein